MTHGGRNVGAAIHRGPEGRLREERCSGRQQDLARCGFRGKGRGKSARGSMRPDSKALVRAWTGMTAQDRWQAPPDVPDLLPGEDRRSVRDSGPFLRGMAIARSCARKIDQETDATGSASCLRGGHSCFKLGVVGTALRDTPSSHYAGADNYPDLAPRRCALTLAVLRRLQRSLSDAF